MMSPISRNAQHAGEREVAVAEQGEVEQRRAAAGFHPDEAGEGDDRQHQRNDHGDRRRFEMSHAVQALHERDHEHGEQRKPEPVDAVGAGGRSARAQPKRQPRRRHQQQVEPEYRAPSRIMRERAADQRADAEAEHQEAGPGADHPRMFGSREIHASARRACRAPRRRRRSPAGRARRRRRAIGREGDDERSEREQRDAGCR